MCLGIKAQMYLCQGNIPSEAKRELGLFFGGGGGGVID